MDELQPIRNYMANPRAYSEGPVREMRDDYVEDQEKITRQSEADDADINNIMKKYEQTGIAPGTRGLPEYGDFSSPVEFREAMDILAYANETFYALDARTRAQFENDPAKFLEFADNPKNAERMVELGLAEPRQPSEKQLLKEMNDNLAANLKQQKPASAASKAKGDTE